MMANKVNWADIPIDEDQVGGDSEISDEIYDVHLSWIKSIISMFEDHQVPWVLSQFIKLAERFLKLVKRFNVVSPTFNLVLDESYSNDYNPTEITFEDFEIGITEVLKDNFLKKDNMRKCFKQIAIQYVSELDRIEKPFFKLEVNDSKKHEQQEHLRRLISNVKNGRSYSSVANPKPQSPQPRVNIDDPRRVLQTYRSMRLSSDVCQEISIYLKLSGLVQESEIWAKKAE
jgi:hypothetical protein